MPNAKNGLGKLLLEIGIPKGTGRGVAALREIETHSGRSAPGKWSFNHPWPMSAAGAFEIRGFGLAILVGMIYG